MSWEEMAAAGMVAREEFVAVFEGMKPAEQKGAQILVDWVRKHFKSAGYKQLLSTKYSGLLTTIPTLEKKEKKE